MVQNMRGDSGLSAFKLSEIFHITGEARRTVSEVFAFFVAPFWNKMLSRVPQVEGGTGFPG